MNDDPRTEHREDCPAHPRFGGIVGPICRCAIMADLDEHYQHPDRPAHVSAFPHPLPTEAGDVEALGDQLEAILDGYVSYDPGWCRAAALAVADEVLASDWLAQHTAAAGARALREAADDFQINTWADVVTPALKTTGLKSLAVTQAFLDWLRDRADRMGS